MAIEFTYGKVAAWHEVNETTIDALWLNASDANITELARVGGGVETVEEAHKLIDEELKDGKDILTLFKEMVFASAVYIPLGKEIATDLLERLDSTLAHGKADFFSMIDSVIEANAELRKVASNLAIQEEAKEQASQTPVVVANKPNRTTKTKRVK